MEPNFEILLTELRTEATKGLEVEKGSLGKQWRNKDIDNGSGTLSLQALNNDINKYLCKV